jgi:hypothetical protein
MMDQKEPSQLHPATKDKSKVTVAIIISMILIGVILFAFLTYQYLIASETKVPVLEVEVYVGEVGDDVFIQRIEYENREMSLLDSPRTDDKGISPGVRVKISRGQDILSFDAFVGYNGEGTYNIICGFKETPNEGDLLECTVWVFSGSGGLYADDQELVQVIWGKEKVNYLIKTRVSIEGSLPQTGSDAHITGVGITSEQTEHEVNFECYFPGVYGYILQYNSQVSYIACKEYKGGDNYTLFIGLLEEPEEGDEFTIVVKVFQRDGQWVDGFYQQPVDSYTAKYVWG